MKWNFIDNYSGDRYVSFKNKTFDMNELKLDQHFLTVTTNNPALNLNNIYLYSLHKECVECPYLFVDKSVQNIFATNQLFLLATEHREYYPQNLKKSVICELDPHFEQFGIYNIRVDNYSSCIVKTWKEPVNAYTPIVTVFLLHLLVFGGIYLIVNLWQKLEQKKSKIIISSSSNDNEKSSPKKERVMSIDAFRGISIVLMIFANFGNGSYAFIEHTPWNGLHVSDLVLPWFLWIMGTCIPISLVFSFKRNVSNKELLWNVLKRSVKLFILGIFLNSGADLYYIRILGVLQRFGLCYFIVTTICIFTMDRDLSLRNKNLVLKYIEDILKLWKAWIICLIILAIHTTLIFTVAEPGCPKGYMGPGGLHKNRSYEKCGGGATGYIDRLILGNHIYQNPTSYEIFQGKLFDPEGLVGSLTTIFHVMLGVQAGITLLVFKSHLQRIIRWLTWSLVLGVLGGALCGFSKENGVIPVNKNLWSISFVFVICCSAFFLLTVCYFLIDVKKWWSGKPLIFAGMNAILLYIGHKMTDNHFPVRWYYSEDLNGNGRRTHFIALLSDIWAADFWVIVSYYLYRIKCFFTV